MADILVHDNLGADGGQGALQDLNRTLETLTADTEKMRPTIERNWIKQLVGEGPVSRAYAEEASPPALAVAVGWMRQGIVGFYIGVVTGLLRIPPI